MMTVLSWNVNGLRAAIKNGFLDWFHDAQPDILCLQETRLLPEEAPDEVRAPAGYHTFWHPAERRGYAGTAVLTSVEPRSVTTLGPKDIDGEGRLQLLEFDAFTLLNGYWPNSQSKRARLPYKLKFCQALTRRANKLVRQGRNVLICGDFNIAHQPIDLARPKDNENNAGYYIEERRAMTRFLKHGYVDTFRHFQPEAVEYTWWSYRTRARRRNIGWRLDYHCVNEGFLPSVKRSWVLGDVYGSDHCPVGIEIG